MPETPPAERYDHRAKAGNFADLHKHWLLHLLLDSLSRDGMAFDYLESHAGAGCYTLAATPSRRSGIDMLWQSDKLPPSLQRLRQRIERFNTSGVLQRYPGSPLIARHHLATGAEAHLYEIAPTVAAELRRCFVGEGNIHIHAGDGFAGVQGHPLSATRQTVVLIDPPYQDNDDYRRAASLASVLAASAVRVQLWYPLFADRREEVMRKQLRQYADWVSELKLDGGGSGMRGSAVALFNIEAALCREAERNGAELARLLGGRMDYWRPS